MFIQDHRRWRLMLAILSLSLLTVMAGAAVAPALDVIQQHFSGEPVILIQLIISMPALFIAITNLFFGKLCELFKGRTLTLIGLAFYVVFGCAAGLCSNIYLLLICRALVGVGVGIIMPMSTGLITYYFTRDKQNTLMGYSSAMNMMGGVVATLIAGFLAMVSWRLSFLVYLLGLISIVLVLLWMPNERIFQSKEGGEGGKKKHGNLFAGYYPWIVGMFLLMVNFFNYPSNFALEVSKSGVVPNSLVPIIMAGMDIFGFLGGLLFPKLKTAMGNNAKYIAPVLFILGYISLQSAGGLALTLIGSFLIGAANGIGVPYFISTASAKAGANAATTVIPALSIALYIAQFTAPTIIAAVQAGFGAVSGSSTSYQAALLLSVVMLLWVGVFDRKKN